VPCNLKEFEGFCKLDPDQKPGPKTSIWYSRWRANDGGMRLDKAVGGEVNANHEFIFSHKPATPTDDFTGIDILFGMVYKDDPFVFHGTKVASFTTETAQLPWILQRKWEDSFQLEWDESYYDISSSEDEDSETDSEEDSLPPGMVQPMGIKGLYGALLMGIPGVNALDRSPEPVVSKFIEEKPDWAGDVTGVWKMKSPQLAKHLGSEKGDILKMIVHVSNNPRHTNVGRQVWVEFDFEEAMSGVMKLSPANSTGDPASESSTLKEFEKHACSHPVVGQVRHLKDFRSAP
jgi:hypothetical protein